MNNIGHTLEVKDHLVKSKLGKSNEIKFFDIGETVNYFISGMKKKIGAGL